MADVPEALRPALAALQQGGIPVALLRGFEATGRFVEVDLLAPAVRRRELTRLLAGCGFAPLRAWGHAGHYFYLGYSVPDRLWVKLDFVTRLPGADVERVLAGRRHDGFLPVLDPDVEGALLLLHCIVDKGGRLGRHESTLRRLAQRPPSPPPGAPEGLWTRWPELWGAVAGSSAALPEGLAKLVAPGRARRARRDRWLRRASYLRRVLRPVAPTVVVRTSDSHAAENLVPGARVLLAPKGRSRLALVRLRLGVELARRRSDAPVVICTGAEASGLANADVTVRAGDWGDSGAPLADRVSEAVWDAYRVTRAARAGGGASAEHRA